MTADRKSDIERQGNRSQDGGADEGFSDIPGNQPDGQGQGGKDQGWEEPAPMREAVQDITQQEQDGGAAKDVDPGVGGYRGEVDVSEPVCQQRAGE